MKRVALIFTFSFCFLFASTSLTASNQATKGVQAQKRAQDSGVGNGCADCNTQQNSDAKTQVKPVQKKKAEQETVVPYRPGATTNLYYKVFFPNTK